MSYSCMSKGTRGVSDLMNATDVGGVCMATHFICYRHECIRTPTLGASCSLGKAKEKAYVPSSRSLRKTFSGVITSQEALGFVGVAVLQREGPQQLQHQLTGAIRGDPKRPSQYVTLFGISLEMMWPWVLGPHL